MKNFKSGKLMNNILYICGSSNIKNMQFWYQRKEGEKTYLDTFNLNKVIRSIGLSDGRQLVLLDDIHERATEVPDINLITGKTKGTKRVRDVYQSELYLTEKEDIERFLRLNN